MDIQRNTYHVSRVKPKRLSDFVNWYTLYQFTDTSPVKLYPEGYFELVFQIGGAFHQNVHSENTWEKRPMQFIGGLHNKSYFIKPETRASSLISVNFKPHSAKYFIPEKLQLFKNKLVCLDDVYMKEKLDRLKSIPESFYFERSIELIETFLISIFTEKARTRVDLALNEILNQSGFVNIGQLAELSCLSESQFRKRFNEEVGMSPKEYSKVVRIKSVAEVLRTGSFINLTELTYQLGYFDQSHFIKDFKSITGISPKKYLR